MFYNELADFFVEFGTHRNIVLSTLRNDVVHSRMMSVVVFDNKFYFQTSEQFAKCKDISENHNVALCADNISVEGYCRKIGHPKESVEFCDVYKKAFPNSYKLYTSLPDEVLYEVIPLIIKVYFYDDGKPYIKSFDMKSEKTSINSVDCLSK